MRKSFEQRKDEHFLFPIMWKIRVELLLNMPLVKIKICIEQIKTMSILPENYYV